MYVRTKLNMEKGYKLARVKCFTLVGVKSVVFIC